MFVSPGEGLLAKEIRRGILTFCVCIVSKGHILAFWSEIGLRYKLLKSKDCRGRIAIIGLVTGLGIGLVNIGISTKFLFICFL